MSDSKKLFDPADEFVQVPEDATKAQKAMALYESMMAGMTALQMFADETVAKNHVGVVFEGLTAPFDRAELTLIRPGGKTPSERARDADADAAAMRRRLEHVERVRRTVQDDDERLVNARNVASQYQARAAIFEARLRDVRDEFLRLGEPAFARGIDELLEAVGRDREVSRHPAVVKLLEVREVVRGMNGEIGGPLDAHIDRIIASINGFMLTVEPT